MATVIKKEVLAIYEKIKDAGFEVFLVGGCVRDLLIGKKAAIFCFFGDDP